jgi:hypothetical protein
MEGMTNENGWKAREGKWNRERNRKRKNHRLKKGMVGGTEKIN